MKPDKHKAVLALCPQQPRDGNEYAEAIDAAVQVVALIVVGAGKRPMQDHEVIVAMFGKHLKAVLERAEGQNLHELARLIFGEVK